MSHRVASSAHPATIVPGLILVVAAQCALPSPSLSAEPDLSRVPGVVVDHWPQSTGRYVGSPAIAILPDGRYVASHDLFGPKSTEHQRSVTRVFRSEDRGRTWKHLTDIHGAFWSSLFTHRGSLYLLGTYHHYGNTVIRRSPDGGESWTVPRDASSGLLLEGGYHCAPMPVIEHAGRLWRAMEDRGGGGGWGAHFRSYMLSAPIGADLLLASSWTRSNGVARDATWLGGEFGGWLEGNAVPTPDGRIVNFLRVECPGGGKAAVIDVSADGRTQTFDPATGFVDFPGGAKKFTIRHDPRTDRYWSLTNWVPPRHAHQAAGGTRNTLTLVSSADLRRWRIHTVLLHHPDRSRHGFQYPDWLFDGNDIVAAIRTAYDDGVGGAHNAHDANLLTFHRFEGFRELGVEDGVVRPDELSAPPRVVIEAPDVTVAGLGFEQGSLRIDALAFGNRRYVWKEVPERFAGWRCTRTLGGEPAAIAVTARRDTVVFMATAASARGLGDSGWRPVEDATFHYTDRGRTRMRVYQRPLAAGTTLAIPQPSWTGGIVLVPPAACKGD